MCIYLSLFLARSLSLSLSVLSRSSWILFATDEIGHVIEEPFGSGLAQEKVGFRVSGSGLQVGFRVSGFGFRAPGSGFRVSGWGSSEMGFICFFLRDQLRGISG